MSQRPDHEADERLAGDGSVAATADAATQGLTEVSPRGEGDDASAGLWVVIPGFTGTLDTLLHMAQRGEIDLAAVPVSEITGQFRRRLAGDQPPDPREIADFLSLAARLLALKAQRLLPDGSIDSGVEDAAEEAAVDDPGARLAEYRLFKAAAEALLAPVAEEGVRSFLGLVSSEVVPTERLAISPERLASAFRAVLARLPEAEPFTVETVTYSVEDKASELRSLLRTRDSVAFEEVFTGARSRLEAVAIFLALLEVIRSGEAAVGQSDPFGSITVSRID